MKNILNAAVTVLIAIVLGMVFLTVVYMLPTDVMKRNVQSSIDIFYTEETYPLQVCGYKLSQLDNETDAIMLLNAIFPNEKGINALKAAMSVPKIDFSDDYSGRSELVKWLWEYKEPDSTTEYARYWHGYLLYLKPLLLLLDYADIRILNQIIQLFLLAVLIVKMVENDCKKCILPLILSIAVINPAAVAMSLQFSSIYYIVLISFIFMCGRSKEYLLQKDYFIFTITGIFTAFFDFLTYPIATLGMTAAFMLVKTQNDHDWKTGLKSVIKWSFFWGLGYTGMWSGKWLVATLILHENILSEVFRQATVHTSDVVIMDEHYNIFQVIWRNIRVFVRWPYLLLGIGVIIYGIKKHYKIDTGKWKQLIPYIVIAILPPVWLMLLKSHSGLLYWYTYRGLTASIFAFFCGLQRITRINKNIQ